MFAHTLRRLSLRQLPNPAHQIELALCDGVEPLHRFARAREKGIHFHKVAVEMRHRLQLS